MEIVYHILGVVVLLLGAGALWLVIIVLKAAKNFFDNVAIANREVTTVKDGTCATCGTPAEEGNSYCFKCGRRFQ
jgi:hypothetical protein